MPGGIYASYVDATANLSTLMHNKVGGVNAFCVINDKYSKNTAITQILPYFLFCISSQYVDFVI